MRVYVALVTLANGDSETARIVIEHPSWTCRPYRPGDEVHLAELFERVFERPITPEFWSWKLGVHADTLANVWLAVDDHDRPVCHYAGIPRSVRLPEGQRAVVVAVDAMTAPEFRRQGVFTAVVARAHAAWRDAGAAFVLGLPNERQARIKALGWQPVASLRWMIRPLRPDVLLARRVRLARLPGLEATGNLWNKLWDFRARRPSGVVFSVADRAESEATFGTLAAARQSKGRLALHRNKEWLVHRLLDLPESPFEIVVARDAQGPIGYAAYRLREANGRKIGAIAELATRHEEDHRTVTRLICEAARRLRDKGAEIAIALTVPGSRDDRLFRRQGFLFSWATFDVQAVPLDPGVPIETLRGSERWTLAGGDFDII